MRSTLLRAVGIAVVLSPVVAYMQAGKSKPDKATYITAEEVDMARKVGPGDRNTKVVDIGHENFTVGIIQRGKTVNGVQVPAGGGGGRAGGGGGAPAAAAEPCGKQMATLPPGGLAGGIIHDFQTEGYYITSGGGLMYTDGYIVNGRHTPGADLNGPTCGGMAYEVTKKQVKVGDIIIVPPGVVHGWLEIPDHVEYLSFRPSPGILTAGWVNPALKK